MLDSAADKLSSKVLYLKPSLFYKPHKRWKMNRPGQLFVKDFYCSTKSTAKRMLSTTHLSLVHTHTHPLTHTVIGHWLHYWEIRASIKPLYQHGGEITRCLIGLYTNMDAQDRLEPATPTALSTGTGITHCILCTWEDLSNAATSARNLQGSCPQCSIMDDTSVCQWNAVRGFHHCSAPSFLHYTVC